MIKKLLATFLITLGFVTSFALAIPQVTQAADPVAPLCTGAGQDSAACTGRSVNNPITDIIARVTQIIFLLTGFASIVVIIVAGLRYVISSGDPNSVNGAKNAILFAVIGLAISAVGGFIVGYVLNKLQ